MAKKNWLDKQLEAARSVVESWSEEKRTALKAQITTKTYSQNADGERKITKIKAERRE